MSPRHPCADTVPVRRTADWVRPKAAPINSTERREERSDERERSKRYAQLGRSPRAILCSAEICNRTVPGASAWIRIH